MVNFSCEVDEYKTLKFIMKEDMLFVKSDNVTEKACECKLVHIIMYAGEESNFKKKTPCQDNVESTSLEII